MARDSDEGRDDVLDVLLHSACSPRSSCVDEENLREWMGDDMQAPSHAVTHPPRVSSVMFFSGGAMDRMQYLSVSPSLGTGPVMHILMPRLFGVDDIEPQASSLSVVCPVIPPGASLPLTTHPSTIADRFPSRRLELDSEEHAFAMFDIVQSIIRMNINQLANSGAFMRIHEDQASPSDVPDEDEMAA